MFKHLLIVSFLYSISLFAFSQDTLQTPKQKKQNLHAEFAGTSFLYSVNYERIFLQSNYFRAGATVGFGAYFYPVFNYNSVSVPVGVFSLLGKKLSFYQSFTYNSLVIELSEYTFKSGMNMGIDYTHKNSFFIRAYPSVYYDYDFKDILIFYGVRVGAWF
ncbi:MAG: hypothetical protein HUU48_11330 [Flavobacteriales bacterium]|nr:hypothetical protein [Flavobacteriales bacterium]